MQNIKQRKQRTFESFSTLDDIIAILKSQFSTRRLYVKYAVDKTEITINEFMDDRTLMVVTDPTYEVEDDIIIYGLSDKFIEIDLAVIEKRGPGYYHCKIKSARRATEGRRDLRFKVTSDDVYATNFRISKQTIDVTNFNIPTSIKVILEQFQSANARLGDIIKVDVFDTSSSNSLLGIIKKTGKTLFVSDTAVVDSYKAMNPDFIDLVEIYGRDIDQYIKKNIERGYKSLLIVPIIYITENMTSVPFGYIQLISKSAVFDIVKVLELKELTFKLVDRIRDANTMFLPTHQDILDVSRGGAKLLISDDTLKMYILKAKGFIFDIVFKLQAPITIYGEIKVSYIDESGNINVGLDFEGNSSRKDEMKRFYAILKPMEIEYKSRLIKTMKARQG